MRKFTIAALTLLLAAPVFAHHSFADYDETRRITRSGTIRDVRFTNPHIGLSVDVRGKKSIESWDFSGPSPADWRAAGWTKSDLKAGDNVTIIGFRKRDGSLHLSINILKLSNGKTFGRAYK